MTKRTSQTVAGHKGSDGLEFQNWVERVGLTQILERVRPLTMVPRECLIDLALQVGAILAYNIPGAFVECGVWRGGASFLMADLLRQAGVRDRKTWLFDSFEGMPTPNAIDGAAAMRWAKNSKSPWYFDNLRAPLEAVQQTAAELGLTPYTEFVQGWFDQTLPKNREHIGPIALLRIDCDWYSSVRCCLDNLYDQVVDGGFVILDDYYTYDGCAIAVHEFLGERHLAHRIEGLVGKQEGFEDYQVALFRKGNITWKWTQLLYRSQLEIAALIPPAEPFILVDENQWGTSEFFAGRRRIPFLERDGQYWGKPPGDVAAIRELKRLRRLGARFIVFGWPAFWWFDYYSGLRHYLRSQFQCVLENERLVIFDLQKPSGAEPARRLKSTEPADGGGQR